ncbi:hypothetical protein DEO72_LG1g1896 [Vigna unguiculata]|uniref:Uncharacterized protein n=1 Tax=Vigna unguiculata TaxID=3917 RepID=A0A4D6KX60_VIGUN|nr:hypothetical protein DEO72_LG1g1896 [Vigna unguiculata]
MIKGYFWVLNNIGGAEKILEVLSPVVVPGSPCFAFPHSYVVEASQSFSVESVLFQGFQVTHIVLLFHYPFSSSIRSLSCCARAFGVEGVLGRLLAYSRYGKLESSVSLVRVCCFVCLVILFCVYLLIGMYDTVGLLLAAEGVARLSETPQPERGAGRDSAAIGCETSGVALQWSRRNSMALVSGCPWWCPICITRRPEIHQGLTLWGDVGNPRTA